MKEDELIKNKKNIENKAVKRIKTGLILNEFGAQNKINVPEQDQGRVAFTRLGQIHVATGATITVSAGTTFVMNVLNIF